MRTLCVVVVFLGMFFWGCEKENSHEDDPIRQLRVETMGRLPDMIPESSGLMAVSPNRIWTHNDSGHDNELFLIDSTGALIQTLVVSNVPNVDWEDLARDTRGNIYINDAGNNRNDRRDLAIYRIPDPDNIAGNSTEAQISRFIFEDQEEFPPPPHARNFCIEAIIWNSDSLFMFTKDRSEPLTGYTKMYGIPAGPGMYMATLIDSFYIGNHNHSRVTGADINFSTGEVVLLTRSQIISFTNYPGNRFFEGEITWYQFVDPVGQVEGITFIDEHSLYISEEREGGYLYRTRLR